LNPRWQPKYKNPPIWTKFGFQVDYDVFRIDIHRWFRRRERIIIIIRRRNGAKTISLQTSFGDLIRIRIVKKKRRITILHPTTVRVM
jgi:hypothetical protein